MKLIKTVVIATLVSLTFSCEGLKSDLFNVEGYLYHNGEVVSQATVLLDDKINYETVSDSSGYFLIKDVPAGEHHISATKHFEKGNFTEYSGSLDVNNDVFLEFLRLPLAVELGVSNVSSTNDVSLVWTSTDATDFREYKIYRHSSSGLDESTGTLIHVSTTITDTTFLDENTSSTEMDFYRVYVMNEIGRLGGSNIVADSSFTNQTWSSQASGSTASLNGICFTDSYTGWAVGNGGTLLSTENQGESWSPHVTQTTADFMEVCFSDSNHGWIVGAGGTILRTIDAGTTWSSVESGTSANLRSCVFIDNNNGWACGGENSPVLLKTSNGGQDWTALNDFSQITWMVFNDIIFSDSLHGWVIGTGLLTFKTSDGGISWTQEENCLPCPPAVSIAHFDNNFWVVTAEGPYSRLYKSYGGSGFYSSSPVFDSSDEHFNEVFFTDALKGWMVTESGLVLGSYSGGDSWVTKYINNGVPVNSIHFSQPGLGWFVGDAGTIIRYKE